MISPQPGPTKGDHVKSQRLVTTKPQLQQLRQPQPLENQVFLTTGQWDQIAGGTVAMI